MHLIHKEIPANYRGILAKQKINPPDNNLGTVKLQHRRKFRFKVDGIKGRKWGFFTRL
jgi:hypothetical protein